MDLIGTLSKIMNKGPAGAETFDNTTDSLEAIRDFLSGAVGDIQGGFYYGVVTAVPGANQFTIAGLAGYGETCFTGWDAYVFWDAGGAGAAPQHETQTVTVYTNLGVFTTAAFTAPVGIGDIMILIHPNLADRINELAVPAADVATNTLERDVIGNKTDTALATANVASVINLLRYCIDSGVGLTAIFTLVNALLVLTETSGTVTATGPGTEDDVYRVETPAGVFKPVAVKIDMTDMTVAETVVIRVYERVITGGAFILTSETTFVGVQAVPLKTVNLDPNRFGILVTLEETAGGLQDYDWSATFEV
jgi:hypothetical protein